MKENVQLRRRFRPALWATVLYIVVFVIMLSLARWQLVRAEEKIALQEAADSARQAVPVEIKTAGPGEFEKLASSYARVSFPGRWRPDRQFLWDNRSHKGQAGFEVITPLQLSDGRYVLVNRGWTAPGASRSDLPDVSFDVSEAAGSQHGATDSGSRITGLFSRPSRGFAQGEPFTDQQGWPRILQYFDYPSMSDALGAPVLPGVVQVLDASESVQSVDASAVWLIPNWQPAASGPAKHYSYAFQWFAMAFALSVLFIVTNLSRPAEVADEDREEQSRT